MSQPSKHPHRPTAERLGAALNSPDQAPPDGEFAETVEIDGIVHRLDLESRIEETDREIGAGEVFSTAEAREWLRQRSEIRSAGLHHG